MFNQSKINVCPDYYRKKLPMDKDDERNGEYVFKTVQPTVVDVTFDLSQLSDTKKAEAIQKLVAAKENGEKAEVLGFNVTKNYKNGPVHYFIVTEVVYTPKPQKTN